MEGSIEGHIKENYFSHKLRPMKTATTIKKIAINEKGVLVAYTRHHFTEDERVLNTEIPMQSEVAPHKDFEEAFQGLNKHAILLLELSLFDKVDKDTLEKHTVTTLSLFDDGNSVMISVNKYIRSGQCYSCTTPKTSLDSTINEYAGLKELKSLIKRIKKEAELYVKGEKHGEGQIELKFEAA